MCDTDVDCSVGTCDTANKEPVTNLTYCSGGCACGAGYLQETDTTTPLGYVCKPLGCKGNPCNKRIGNSNACSENSADAGGYKCTCDSNWTGDNCTIRAKGLFDWPCNSDAECDTSLRCRGNKCLKPKFELSNMADFPYDRCPGGMNRTLDMPWYYIGDTKNFPTDTSCVLVGSAPTCMGNSQSDCENPEKGGNADMELVAVTGRDGRGSYACSENLFKGLCAPRKCDTDGDCALHRCIDLHGTGVKTCAG